MAKDVDLSSKEWLDIVFEGKNKEYGAYELRSKSTGRHTRAVIIVVLIILVILGLLILSLKGFFGGGEDEGADAAVNQEMPVLADTEEAPEEEEMEVFDIPEPEPQIEEILLEDVANEQQVTDILITKDDEFDESKQVKESSEVMENEAQFGSVDITDGTNDLNKTEVKEKVIVEEKKPEPKDEPVSIAMVEQKPQFKGGDAAMYKWLSDNIRYPQAAAEEGIEGRVTVQFMIDKDGSIKNVKVVRGRDKNLDKEAVRVVSAMPAWIPGKNNGAAVKVIYTLPVTFKLEGGR